MHVLRERREDLLQAGLCQVRWREPGLSYRLLGLGLGVAACLRSPAWREGHSYSERVPP